MKITKITHQTDGQMESQMISTKIILQKMENQMVGTCPRVGQYKNNSPKGWGDGGHKNNSSKGWTDGELNDEHENNSPKDGKSNERHENITCSRVGQYKNNSPKGWVAQK